MNMLFMLLVAALLQHSFALKLQAEIAPKFKLKKESESDALTEGMQKPISQEDFDFGEQFGLRPDLEKGISNLSDSGKPTLYFIGDSLLRNQAAAACAIVTKSDKLFPEWKYVNGNIQNVIPQPIQSCKGELGHVVFQWTQDFCPQCLGMLQKSYPAPDLIYLNANLHDAVMGRKLGLTEEFVLKYYRINAKTALGNAARAAPNAQIKVFLSHKLCNEKWIQDKSWISLAYPSWLKDDGITNEMVQARNDILKQQAMNAPRHIAVVDGYALTEKLGCNATEDGRHYDKYVFHELTEMLKA